VDSQSLKSSDGWSARATNAELILLSGQGLDLAVRNGVVEYDLGTVTVELVGLLDPLPSAVLLIGERYLCHVPGGRIHWYVQRRTHRSRWWAGSFTRPHGDPGG
jgi:hypothetical protein